MVVLLLLLLQLLILVFLLLNCSYVNPHVLAFSESLSHPNMGEQAAEGYLASSWSSTTTHAK